jgi:hypothetical protein
MSKAKRLTKRQLAVIEDLFAGKLDESAVLKQHKVSRALYNKWLADPVFTKQFDLLIDGAYRRSAFKIARSAKEAAEKLLLLTNSDKGETARKACLDIITMHPSIHLTDSPTVLDRKETSSSESTKLTPETASKLLAVLAEEK